jgi:hypothetical protein
MFIVLFSNGLAVGFQSKNYVFNFETLWFTNFIFYITGPKRKYASLVRNSTTPTNTKKKKKTSEHSREYGSSLH